MVMMYTTNEVAAKTKTKPAAVRYFARTNNLAKAKIKNTDVYIFDKNDFDRYVFYIGKKESEYNEKQYSFDFYETQNKQRRARSNTKKVLRKTKHAELLRILQQVGENGIKRAFLATMLKVDDNELEKILAIDPNQPIGEDDRIDDKIYWMEKWTWIL